MYQYSLHKPLLRSPGKINPGTSGKNTLKIFPRKIRVFCMYGHNLFSRKDRKESPLQVKKIAIKIKVKIQEDPFPKSSEN